MIKRAIFDSLLQQVDYKKAIILLGPRQVGKTTLLNDIAANLDTNFLRFDGDELLTLEQLSNASLPFLKSLIGNKKVVLIDEAQRIKNIGLTIKLLVDNVKKIQLLVSGSSALELANIVNEPLTGRKWEHILYPISWKELCDYESMANALLRLPNLLVYGMYPEVLTSAGQERSIITNLASSYLYKDLLNFQGIRRPELLNKILLALSFQVGSLVNMNELGRTVQANKITVSNYIDLLEKAFIIYRLSPFNRNLRTEISSNKKIYFYDNGIRNAIVGNFSSIDLRNDIGALWENFLIMERKKLLGYNGFYGRTYFWRTHAGQEIDYIEEIDGKIYVYEFKWNPNAKTKIPQSFIETYKPEEIKTIHRDNFWEWLQKYPYQ